MQLLKVVFALIAIGGPGYALFRFSHDAPAWVKVLSVVVGIATLIATVIILPQALDALEQTANRVSGYFVPSEQELQRRAESEARRKADEEARRRAADEAVQHRIEQARRKADEEAARRRESEARLKAEETRQRAEQEARMRAETQARIRAAEEEARRKVAEEARRRAEAEARARQWQSRQQRPSNPIHTGGVIPCSADDQSFIPGRGWVPNCR